MAGAIKALLLTKHRWPLPFQQQTPPNNAECVFFIITGILGSFYATVLGQMTVLVASMGIVGHPWAPDTGEAANETHLHALFWVWALGFNGRGLVFQPAGRHGMVLVTRYTRGSVKGREEQLFSRHFSTFSFDNHIPKLRMPTGSGTACLLHFPLTSAAKQVLPRFHVETSGGGVVWMCELFLRRAGALAERVFFTP